MQETLDIVNGVALPLYPMQPTHGRTLRAPRLLEEIYQEIKKQEVWIAQPILAGDRAILAVVDKSVYVQDERGKWRGEPLRRARDFLKLPNRTVFDGIIFNEEFHPFDLLALDNKTMLYRSTSEREALTYQMVRFIEHPWMFRRPTKAWLQKGTKNLPVYKGVILKDAGARYPQANKPGQCTLSWFTRKWS